MGRAYAKALTRSARWELAGVVVGRPETASRLAAELALPVGTDLPALLDRVAADALIVASPTEVHHAQVALALDRRLPCLVEKPVAADVREAADLAARNRVARVPVVVGHTLVFSASFLRLLALVKSGRVGAVRSARLASLVRLGEGWSPRSGGYWTRDFLLNLALHRVALLNRLFERDPVAVRLRRVDVAPGAEHLEAELTYAGSGAQHFSLALGAEPSRLDLQVETDRGRFDWTSGAPGEALAFTPGGGARREVPFGAGEPLDRLLDAFADFLDRGLEPFEGLEQGLSALKATRDLVAPLFDDPLRVTLRDLAEVAVDGSVWTPAAPCLADGPSGAGPSCAVGRRKALPEGWPEPEEVAFRLGRKPVLYRTVPAGQARTVRARFPDAHVEEVPHRLRRDAVQDLRSRGDEGEPHVDLFLSHDPALAARAAAIYREGRVGAAVEEMGDLLGYPRCCARAFAALPDRSNNSFLRHATWQGTVRAGHAFHASLSNLTLVATPYTPCSYGCPAALDDAAAVFAALPDASRFLAWLAQPALYIDDTRLVLFEGEGDVRELCYRSFCLPEPRHPAQEPVLARFEADVAAPLAAGDRLVLAEGRLTVYAGERIVHAWSVPHPGAVRLFPFGFR